MVWPCETNDMGTSPKTTAAYSIDELTVTVAIWLQGLSYDAFTVQFFVVIH